MIKNGYASLALQTAASAIIMYLVMFVMIDSLSSFYNNLNMLYMTLMMVTPMAVLMIVAMRHMFRVKSCQCCASNRRGGCVRWQLRSDPDADDGR